MALSDYGTSFSPMQPGGSDKTKPGGGGQPTQDAIRTISTRIPRITQGGQSLAPQPLLNAPGGAGMASPMGSPEQPNMGGLEDLIRRLFGLFGNQGGMAPAGAGAAGPAMGGASAGAAPAPRVIPGLQQPAPPGGPIQVQQGPSAIPETPNWGTFNPGQQGSLPGGPYRGPFGGG